MSNQENKDFIDLGSDPIGDDFDPFASDDDLNAEIPAPEQQSEKPAGDSISANPLETAINTAEDKAVEKAQQGPFDKPPVFEYAGATEEIADTSITFDELRIEKAADFPELDDGKRVSWTVEYGKITKTVPDPKATSIGKMKSDIETSKEFLDSLKKAKDKNPACKIKPRVTAQSKGIASYKGIFHTVEEAKASDKPIRIIPARDGHVYEMRHTEAGRFIARADNVKELSEINAGYIPAFPPLPFEQFCQIIAFFRHYMHGGRESEVMVYLYWDKLERKNLVRQNFIAADLGRNKAQVLAERYASAFGMETLYIPEFIESGDVLMELVKTYRFQTGNCRYADGMSILIGAVDNNRSRQLCHTVFKQADNLIYIDSGNGEYTGQVVCGIRRGGRTYYKPLGDLYPDILNDTDKFPSELSCAEAAVSTPQSIVANIMAATAVVSYLYNILVLGNIEVRSVTFSTKSVNLKPVISQKRKRKAA